MGLINKDVFFCIDCETTGLDPENEKIIEVAAVKFTFEEILETYETLIDPGVPIPDSSREIHHISDDMVKGKPKVEESCLFRYCCKKTPNPMQSHFSSYH
jgi:DNA polymerase-3 subunit epsilon